MPVINRRKRWCRSGPASLTLCPAGGATGGSVVTLNGKLPIAGEARRPDRSCSGIGDPSQPHIPHGDHLLWSVLRG